jgi:hypothetical protein
MIKYSIKRDNGEEMNGQAKLVIMSTIVNEYEEGYEGETAIVTADDGDITVGIVLLALANLVASVVKSVAEDDNEKAKILGYIITTVIDMMHKESLN